MGPFSTWLGTPELCRGEQQNFKQKAMLGPATEVLLDSANSLWLVLLSKRPLSPLCSAHMGFFWSPGTHLYSASWRVRRVLIYGRSFFCSIISSSALIIASHIYILANQIFTAQKKKKTKRRRSDWRVCEILSIALSRHMSSNRHLDSRRKAATLF